MNLRPVVFVVSLTVFVALISSFAVPVNTPNSRKLSNAATTELRAMVSVGVPRTPVVTSMPGNEEVTVTFLAKASGADAPRIVSDIGGWGERPDGSFDVTVGAMTRVDQTDWYALQYVVPSRARIEYLIAYGATDYRVDPHNPRQVQRVAGPASEFVAPGYGPPPEFESSSTRPPAGTITETVLDSRALKGTRRVIVYTPPNYTKTERYPLAVFHDGALMVNTGKAPEVIDWLIAHQRIPPIVAVFVDPVSRTDDFRRGAPMGAFVKTELLPWMTEHYSVTDNATDRAVIGVSAGARAAVDEAASLDTFQRLGLLIPAVSDDDLSAIASGSSQQLRATIVAARYDRLYLSDARAAAGALRQRGHSINMVEVPEGHTTATWRNHLGEVLTKLFGKGRPN